MSYKNKKSKESESPTEIWSQGRLWPNGTFWIIVNRVRGSIWKQTYFSYEDAKTEYDRQMAALRTGYTGKNWKIEVRMPNEHQENDKRRVDEEIKRQEDNAELDSFIKNATDNF
jgi:hypothetical protein